jgi:alpha,alpha-trehalose phosphorylase
MASLAGTWIGLVAGLGGMRECGPTLKFAPQLPEGIARLSFNVEFRGRRLHVEATPSTTSYVLKQGDDLEILHFEDAFTVSASQESIFEAASDDAERTTLSPPRQPYGREPTRRLAVSAKREEGP